MAIIITTVGNGVNFNNTLCGKEGWILSTNGNRSQVTLSNKVTGVSGTALVTEVEIDESTFESYQELQEALGSVLFKAGGSGPGAEWGVITGNIEDQEDLIELITSEQLTLQQLFDDNVEEGVSIIEIPDGFTFDGGATGGFSFSGANGLLLHGSNNLVEIGAGNEGLLLNDNNSTEGIKIRIAGEIEENKLLGTDADGKLEYKDLPSSSTPTLQEVLTAGSEVGDLIITDSNESEILNVSSSTENPYVNIALSKEREIIGDTEVYYSEAGVYSTYNNDAVNLGIFASNYTYDTGYNILSENLVEFGFSTGQFRFVHNTDNEEESYTLILPTSQGEIGQTMVMGEDAQLEWTDPTTSSLSFENGLTEEDGVVKLGGEVTESFNFINQDSDYKGQIGINFDSDYTNSGFSNWSNTGFQPYAGFEAFVGNHDLNIIARVDINAGDNNGSCSLIMDTVTGIIITDDLSGRGIEYADDYSANFTDRSLVDKAFVDSRLSDAQRQAIDALVSPETDYADMTEATAAIKAVIDALKAV